MGGERTLLLYSERISSPIVLQPGPSMLYAATANVIRLKNCGGWRPVQVLESLVANIIEVSYRLLEWPRGPNIFNITGIT